MAVPAPGIDKAPLHALLRLLPSASFSAAPAASPPTARLAVVLKPRASAGKAKTLWATAAAPLKEQSLSVKESAVERTVTEGDSARLGRALRGPFAAAASYARVDGTKEGEAGEAGTEMLVIVGGDGTVHEVLNGLLLDGTQGEELWVGAGRVKVILMCDTISALVCTRRDGQHAVPPSVPARGGLLTSHLPAAPFYSLLSFLRSLARSASKSSTSSAAPTPSLLPLPLALNTLPSTPPTLTTVVSSSALHATLLHDAKVLRATHPSLERFKLAAQANITCWWASQLLLRGNVRRYDPSARAWSRLSPAEVQEQGSWAYLICALASRFEPAFVVVPFRLPSSPLAPSQDEGGHGSIDVVAIRPLQHAPSAALER